MRSNNKNVFLWVFIACCFMFISRYFQGSSSQKDIPFIDYSQFVKEIETGQIDKVTIEGRRILGHTRDGRPFHSYAPEHSQYVDQLIQSNVVVKILPEEVGKSLFQILAPWLPLIVLLSFGLYSFRKMRSGGDKP